MILITHGSAYVGPGAVSVVLRDGHDPAPHDLIHPICRSLASRQPGLS
jgi:hypothetical protein